MNAPIALMTEDEAAKALRVCTRTLRKARNEGRLTYVLFGRSVRYTLADLESFIQSARQDVQPCPRQPTKRSVSRHRQGNIIPFSARQ